MTEKRKLTVCWVSAGVSSFIAEYITKDEIDESLYIDIADQHPDSLRFIADCEKAIGKPTGMLRSAEYSSVADAVRAGGVFRMVRGFAPCTNYLKKRVRKEWERAHEDCEITYVWGFDSGERRRAENLVDAMPQFKHRFPLIENNLTKQDAHAMLARLQIKRPVMYDMGYNNNNCIGCVKGGMGYWNKIRVDFPEVFESRARLEREIGRTCLKECYLDELDPTRGRMSEAISEDCGIFCEIALGGIKNA